MLKYLVPAFVSIAAVAPLGAQTTPFTKIADTATAVPDGTGNFETFSNMISVDVNGHVAFSEDGSTSNDGMYFWTDGVITRAANLATPIPGGIGNFEEFSFFGNGIDDETFAFRGNGSGDQSGVYAYEHDGGILSVIADTSTAIPNGTGNFTEFTTAYVQGSSYAFIAWGDSDQQGIYVFDGISHSRIADNSIAVPGIGGTYEWSSQLGFDQGNLAFRAHVTGGSAPGDIIGGYTPGDGLLTLVTTATPVPGLGTNFSWFASPAGLSGTTVAFKGAYSGGDGIFTTDLEGGAINTIVRTPTAAPGGGGNFSFFFPPSIDGEVIAFQAFNDSGVSGIYLHHEGRVRKVISTADTLGGKSINSLQTSENALAGGFLAFRANFSDSTSGIYRLTISELVDAPQVNVAKRKATLRKAIKRVNKQLKRVRKAGQRAKVKRFTATLRKLRKELRRL